MTVRIGCAGWALPKKYGKKFPAEGSHLVRYAGVFPAVEINSSFYRSHKPATYTKWAKSVPADFRFVVKVPKEATHAHRLTDAEGILDRFLPEVTALGEKLGALLVQVPPSLEFSATIAEKFFKALRLRFAGDVVFEPRHPSWFETKADKLIAKHRVARVAADPAVVERAAEPGGWTGLVYYRLHGSPRIYYSSYSCNYLAALARKLTAAQSVATWCIFANTAASAAIGNALDVMERLRKQGLIAACRA